MVRLKNIPFCLLFFACMIIQADRHEAFGRTWYVNVRDASSANVQDNDHEVFDKRVRISKNKGTIYELLKIISKQSGYLFIYDSQIIENDKTVKVPKGTFSLRDAIYLITGNRQLQLDLTGNYILLRLSKIQIPVVTNDSIPAQDLHFTIRGALSDLQTGEAVIYASAHILNTSIGTVTNQDGGFQLSIPDSLQHLTVRFSHIGYESREIELSLLKDGFVDLGLNPQVIPLQEVVISAVNPLQALQEMFDNRVVNYASEPTCLTSFYREGIDHNDRNIDLTEAVLQIYKTGYQKKANSDQVKLIKKRRIVSRIEPDTIFPKMRSGIQSCLVLDVIKELPDFIVPNPETPYLYVYKGKNIIDERPVHIIGFQQKDYIPEPLYCGELYIEEGNKALVEVRFEINTKLVNKATNSFIDKKPFAYTMNLQEARYKVSYKLSGNGYYYTNHVRGDVSFTIRRKNRLFSSTLHFWFEMATCDIDTENTKPFPPDVRLSTTRIFAETKSGYDKNFWEHFNIILPEENLRNILIHNLHEVLIAEPK